MNGIMRSRLSSNPGQFILIFVILLLKIVLMRFFFYEGFRWNGFPAEALSALMLLGLFDLLFFPLQKKSPVYWCFNFVYSFTLFAATLYFAHFGTVPT
ncbi:LTA synthase family protein, partial [Clostridium perfringens]